MQKQMKKMGGGKMQKMIQKMGGMQSAEGGLPDLSKMKLPPSNLLQKMLFLY
jgi:signal recognition particle subunit SRP54